VICAGGISLIVILSHVFPQAVKVSDAIVADFHTWRHQRDWTGWKYAMWDAGFKLPIQLPSGRCR
jgi:hypothetical protein